MTTGIVPGLRANSWRNFEPGLFSAANGAVTHPVLGPLGVTQGRYIELDGLVMAQIKLVAALSGASVGSGSCYVMRLPVPALRAWDTQVIGQGFPYRAVTGLSYEWACPVTLADPWTSLGVDADSYCQMWTPWTMLLGTATIAAAGTSVTVTHNLGYAPDAADITVNLTQAPGGGGANTRWPLMVTSITSTQFTVSNLAGGSMTTTDQTLEWKIRAEPQSATVASWLIGPKYGRPFNALSSVLFQVYYEPA